MNVLFLGVAILLCLLVGAGWVMLLSMPLIVLTAATIDGVTKGAVGAKRFLPALSREAERGILCIEGLLSESAVAKRLRSDIARVLRSAKRGTRPRACACVKESGGAFIGVLRIFNTNGHYLLRASGGSAGTVAVRFSEALGELHGAFPARDGTRRVQCPECDPKTCPLRRRNDVRSVTARPVARR